MPSATMSLLSFYNGLPAAPRTSEEVGMALRKADIPMTAEVTTQS